MCRTIFFLYISKNEIYEVQGYPNPYTKKNIADQKIGSNVRVEPSTQK